MGEQNAAYLEQINRAAAAIEAACGGAEIAVILGSGLGGLDVIGLNGGADGLDGGLELGADSLVALTRLLSGDDALLLRLDVSHVQFLSVPNNLRPLC